MAGCDAALIATPSSELREVLGRMRASGFEQPVIWACKGFERASGKLPHQVAAEVLGKRAACGALSGPSFALEVAQGRPTALTLAARGEPLEAILKELGHVAEGVASAPAVEALAAEKRVDMPITRAVCAVLFRGTPPRDAVQELLARDPREEA